jgi:hypothetical protein
VRGGYAVGTSTGNSFFIRVCSWLFSEFCLYLAFLGCWSGAVQDLPLVLRVMEHCRVVNSVLAMPSASREAMLI